jgi:ABC-type polysaccharide/polyol phosphate export permease
MLILLFMLPIFQVPLTKQLAAFFPLFISQFLLLSGLGLWFAHIGVYFSDIDKLFSFALRIWYYLSPGLYKIDSIPEKYQKIMWLNPLATTFESSRNIFLYGKPPIYNGLILWGSIGVLLIISGIYILEKNDRYYTKII